MRTPYELSVPNEHDLGEKPDVSRKAWDEGRKSESFNKIKLSTRSGKEIRKTDNYLLSLPTKLTHFFSLTHVRVYWVFSFVLV